jgi:hypothetical protein
VWIIAVIFSRLARSKLSGLQGIESTVKFTKYFDFIRQRPDRAIIRDEWIERVLNNPVKETVQQDGRIRRWARLKRWKTDSCGLSYFLIVRRYITPSLTGDSSHDDQVLSGH